NPRWSDKAAQSYIYQNLTSTLLATLTSVSYRARAPLFTRIAPPQPQISRLPFELNLLSTTLAIAVPTPPVQLWFEPRIPASSPHAALQPIHVNLLNTLLTT